MRTGATGAGVRGIGCTAGGCKLGLWMAGGIGCGATAWRLGAAGSMTMVLRSGCGGSGGALTFLGLRFLASFLSRSSHASAM